jgi:hypothetical protein
MEDAKLPASFRKRSGSAIWEKKDASPHRDPPLHELGHEEGKRRPPYILIIKGVLPRVKMGLPQEGPFFLGRFGLF